MDKATVQIHTTRSMCGIAGFLDANRSMDERKAALAPMLASLRHRGPDGEGEWHCADSGASLGHRRLAIVELSALGRQPMISANGRFVLTFNGEIYNYPELRADLLASGAALRGGSDTEALLEMIARDGLLAALKRSIGMFAFGLYDRAEKTLFMARDPMGEKPLCYGYIHRGVFAFASEVRALRAHASFSNEISQESASEFMRYSYVPEPLSIFSGIGKLSPGCYAELKQADFLRGTAPTIRPFWRLEDAVLERPRPRPPASGESDAVAPDFEARLRASVSRQMQADVPLGAFLSGGIDSSTVVAFMQELSARKTRTFTIGFEESGYDEAPFAKAVANHLGTEHSELYVSASDALAVAPTMPAIYDEPFADSSQIPTFLLCQMARKSVTVALSGDGGDEIFGGYNRYLIGPRLWKRMQALPSGAKRALSATLLATKASTLDGLFKTLAPLLPPGRRHGDAGLKLHKFARALRALSQRDLYLDFVAGSDSPNGLRARANAPTHFDDSLLASSADRLFPAIEKRFSNLGFAEKMMIADALSYLPGDILPKVDRAAMAVSLETRVPLLDRELVEFAWSLPIDDKIRGGESKALLRQALYRRVPEKLFQRPKAGFGIPLGDWLRGPLRDWSESLLSESALKKSGVPRPEEIRAKWKAYLAGKANLQSQVWNSLMLQGWLSASVLKAASTSQPSSLGALRL